MKSKQTQYNVMGLLKVNPWENSIQLYICIDDRIPRRFISRIMAGIRMFLIVVISKKRNIWIYFMKAQKQKNILAEIQ